MDKQQPTYDISGQTLILKGCWLADSLTKHTHITQKLAIDAIDGSSLKALDTIGILAILSLLKQSPTLQLRHFKKEHKTLFELVQTKHPQVSPHQHHLKKLPPLAYLGKITIEFLMVTREFISFIGQIILALFHLIKKPKDLRLNSLSTHMEQTGLYAIPIVCLLAFLIGVVLSYQVSFQLKKFGAEVYTIDFVTIITLREVGILIAAILVAGRSASAFAAQIGMMKLNFEVDALKIMGIDTLNALVIPRVLGSIICLPLLAFLANVASIFGGALIAFALIDIPFEQFINHMQTSLHSDHLWVGMIKAPVFAFFIATIGCFEGAKVTHGAENIGRHTTKAVVEAIFLIILLDALFSILFSEIGM